jgi:hypothetical protein
MSTEADALKAAAERLKNAKEKIDKKHENSKASEPKTIVSGRFDDVELKRREKRGDEYE